MLRYVYSPLRLCSISVHLLWCHKDETQVPLGEWHNELRHTISPRVRIWYGALKVFLHHWCYIRAVDNLITPSDLSDALVLMHQLHSIHDGELREALTHSNILNLTICYRVVVEYIGDDAF